MHQQSSESVLTVAAKLSPPATVLGASAAGMSLQDWVWAATLAYTVLMTAKLLWDWVIKPNLRPKSMAEKIQDARPPSKDELIDSFRKRD